MLTIPYLLRENVYDIFHVDDNADVNFYQRIKCLSVTSDSDALENVFIGECEVFEIVVDNRMVARTNDFFQEFSVMMASYYVFNLEYPNTLVGTLSFIQRYILGISDSTKTLQRVLTLVAKVRKNSSVNL